MLSELSVLCIAFSLTLFQWDLHAEQYSSCGFCFGNFTLRILETMNMNEPGELPQGPLRDYRKTWRGNRVDVASEVDDRSEPSIPPPEESNLFADERSSNSDIEGWDLVPFGVDELYELESPTDDQFAIQSYPKVCDPFKTEPAWVNSALAASSKRQRVMRPKLPWEHTALSQVLRTADKWQGTVLAQQSDMYLQIGIG